MNNQEPVIRRVFRTYRRPSNDHPTAHRLSLAGLVIVLGLLVMALNSVGAAAVPLTFQSANDTPTPTPSPTPTLDPLLFPTATPTFDPALFPTPTPTFDPQLLPTVAPEIDGTPLPPATSPTAGVLLPSGSLTDSLSSALEPSGQSLPAAPEALPLLPKPEPGSVPVVVPKAADPANEARLFGQTVMAAVTYIWMGCGVMLLLLAGATLLWLNRRSRQR